MAQLFGVYLEATFGAWCNYSGPIGPFLPLVGVAIIWNDATV